MNFQIAELENKTSSFIVYCSNILPRLQTVVVDTKENVLKGIAIHLKYFEFANT